jgi:hypothetical protein
VIRPEAKAQLLRWREVLAGAGALLVGLWWLTRPGLLLTLPGGALVLAGAALIWVGLQRARFRREGQGPGSVDVDEGEITYFGPLTGGAVSLRELREIAYDPTSYPAHWRLRQEGVPEVVIPVNAAGAEALFDAFATLPQFRMEQALAVQKRKAAQPIVIWRRDPSVSAYPSLH